MPSGDSEVDQRALSQYLQNNSDKMSADLADRIAEATLANPNLQSPYSEALPAARAKYGQQARQDLYQSALNRAVTPDEVLQVGRDAAKRYDIQPDPPAAERPPWWQGTSVTSPEELGKFTQDLQRDHQFNQLTQMMRARPMGGDAQPVEQPSSQVQTPTGYAQPAAQPHASLQPFTFSRTMDVASPGTMPTSDPSTPQAPVNYRPLADTMQALIARNAMTPEAAALATRQLYAPVMSHGTSQGVAQQVQAVMQPDAQSPAAKAQQQSAQQQRQLASLAMIFGGGGS